MKVRYDLMGIAGRGGGAGTWVSNKRAANAAKLLRAIEELRAAETCPGHRPLPGRPGIRARCMRAPGHDGRCISRGGLAW